MLLPGMSKNELEDFGRSLEPPLELDKRKSQAVMVEALHEHAADNGIDTTVPPWIAVDEDPPQKAAAVTGKNAREQADILDALEEVTQIPRANQNYLSPRERNFREQVRALVEELRAKKK